jgi:hypothetical protein
LRFIYSRLLPSRAALEGLELVLQVQPQLGRVPWYGRSQGERIARWLFSRPPRVQTMVSVLAALESVEPAHGRESLLDRPDLR